MLARWNSDPARRIVALLFVLSGYACAEERDPIQVEDTAIAVFNQTSKEWQDIEVWVNDHYRGTAEVVPAGGRLDIPLRNLVAGFGQRFDPSRQQVSGVEVTAHTTDGDLRLVWGNGRRR